MKRKLIEFDVFKKIEEDSLSNAQHELTEAEDVLANTLGVDDLKLHCFGEQDVTYKTLDGTYVHATYTLDNNKLALENIEELVIEQESEKKNARNLLTSMVENLLDNQEEKASNAFAEYLSLPVVRRDLTEATKITVSKPTGSLSPLAHKKQSSSLVAKRTRARNKTLRRLASSSGLKKNRAQKRDVAANKLGQTTSKRARVYMRTVKPAKMKEWAVLSENVVDFVNYKELGPVMKDAVVATDDRGNVTAVALPTSQRRNEGKILSFNWKTLDHEVKILRGNVKKVNEDVEFVKAIAELKRYNGISDDAALERTIESIVTKWPDLLYLSQTELAAKIGEALETAGVKSYDDQMCDFMAEGILRTAHHAFADRVKKIGTVAGVDLATEVAKDKDNYAEFQAVVHKFYPSLDEADDAEMRVFADLYKALHEVFRLAGQAGDEATKAEVANFMSECQTILNRENQPSLELAEAIAAYLYDLAETNLGLGSEWGVSNDTHMTLNGDHPAMAEKARKGYTPASDFESDYGDTAPVSDGKSYKGGLADEMRNRSWGNHSGDGIYPSLKNPYVPAPFGDYTMKGEKGAEKDGESDWSRWQSGDTWPNLQNPYTPKAVTPQSYKMKSDNLVVDK